MRHSRVVAVAIAITVLGAMAWEYHRLASEVELVPVAHALAEFDVRSPTQYPPPNRPERPAFERRSDYHRQLEAAFRGEDPHDACLGLVEVGDATSVPLLIDVLQTFPDDPAHGVVCTWDHCVSALRTITGADPGMTHSAWRKWFDENK